MPIDAILHHYNLGSTPEQIAWKFQGLRTADIYAVIAYYLNNRNQINQYLLASAILSVVVAHLSD